MMTAEQLKASILQLAIQGKLVEQRAEEGTGEELLSQVREEKQALIKAGKVKKSKSCAAIIEDEISFDIPSTWKWTRFDEVILLLSGADLTPDKYNDLEKGTVYLTGASNIENGNIIINRWTEFPKNIAHKGDLLLTCKGTVGKTAILDLEEVHIARQIMAITPILCNVKYIDFFLQYIVESLKKEAKSMIPGIERSTVLNALLPLPPLEEQKRIVAKIEELIPFVEQYAKTSTRLNTLNASFPDRMKKSILQQAVMGKLVPQDPKDEPASVLLKKIAEEKLKLIKEGKIKKQKALPAITEDEIPFDIPESWEWVQLDELAIFENGDRGKNYPNKSEYVQSGVAWINTSHIKTNGYLTTTEMNYITREKFETLRSGKIEENDLVFCLRGATYGKVSRVEPYTEGAVASSLMIIRPIISILRDYLLLYLKTPLAFSELAKYANGSAQPNLGAKDVRKYLVPLPPLKEQKRILECVEEILPKLDDLRK